MGKKKLTLSIDEDLLRDVRSMLAGEGESISEVVEELLESVSASRWIEGLAEALGLKRLNPLDPAEIPKTRPPGLDAAKLVKELRRQRLQGA